MKAEMKDCQGHSFNSERGKIYYLWGNILVVPKKDRKGYLQVKSALTLNNKSKLK